MDLSHTEKATGITPGALSLFYILLLKIFFTAVSRLVLCLFDVSRPLDITVGSIGQIAKLQDQQYKLSGKNVDDCLQQRADIPGDLLFTETEEDKQTVGHCHGTGAGIQIDDPGLDGAISTEKIRGNIQAGQSPSNQQSPQNDGSDD